MKENRSAANELFTRLSPKADKAEIATLENHPLKNRSFNPEKLWSWLRKLLTNLMM